MVSESEPKRITGGEGSPLPPEGTPFLNIGLSEIYIEIANNQRKWRFNTSNVCGSNLPVGARWDEIEREGWQKPIVHFVFQSEALAERARLSFGFTNTSAPFAVTQERIGAEYRVQFQYIGGQVYQPNQQLVVYYNGAPAGWLWILPYLIAGQIGWYSRRDRARWQIQNPAEEAIVENSTIPGLPIAPRGDETTDALEITIEQSYAEWSESMDVNFEFRCFDSNGEYVTKTFGTKDVGDIDASADVLVIYFHGKWADWFRDWDIVEVEGLTGDLNTILWDSNQIEFSIDVGN